MKERKAEWETCTTNSPEIIYLGFKPMYGTRYNHYHITREDVRNLIKDLETILDSKEKLKIEHKI